MWNKVKHYLNLIFVKNGLYVLLMVGLLVIDLVTKVVMENILKNGSSITVIPGIFDFALVYNTGSFSGWLGSEVGHILLIIISFVGAIGLPYLFIRFRNKWNKGMLIGLALCIPGDIGNLVDRLVYVDGNARGVIDFLYFHIDAWNFSWPVFNVADMCLVVGVIVFAIFYIIYDNKEEKAKKAAQEKAIQETKKRLEEEKNAEKGDSNGQ